jgi:hypothetical protein
MLEILAGSFLLSIVHASIPNHWLPLVAISRSENWHRGETLGATAIAGVAHTLSTIIIGIIVGLLGYKLAENFELVTAIIAPSILVVLGLIYLILGLTGGHHHHHSHDLEKEAKKARTKTAIIATLALAMFFSPCIEIEAYYFNVGSHGWMGIVSLSLIYLVVTVTGMVLLVDIARQGAAKINAHWLEHHERTITGVVLILTGVAAYLLGNGH